MAQNRWREEFVYFDGHGILVVHETSELNIVGNVELGGLLNAGGARNSTEQGMWTVVRSPFGPLLVLQAANGLAIVTFKLPSPGRLILLRP